MIASKRPQGSRGGEPNSATPWRTSGWTLLSSPSTRSNRSTSRPTRIVNEALEGNFYVVLKALFNGPRLYVPFRNGVLVLDRSAWLHEAYTGPSPVSTELRPGCDPSYPENPRLWYE